MTSLMDIVDRAVCLVRGHRWSSWQQGRRLAPHFEGYENRFCYRCPKNEYRPDEAYGYEMDADPKPRDGDHGTCAICGGEIHYWEATAWNGVEDDVIDTHWSHVQHPADGHDAEIGGPA